MTYDPTDNAIKSYDVAIAALREQFVQKNSGSNQMTMPAMTFEAIVEAAAEVCSVLPGEITGKSRCAGATLARQFAMAVMADKTGCRVKELAGAFGRDSSTVSHSLALVRKMVESDGANKARFDAISERAAGWQCKPSTSPARICYTVADRNDIAMVRAKADHAERALIALLRLDYASREIDLPRAARAAPEDCELV